MSLFQFTELPPEKEAEKNTPCLQQQGLLLVLSDRRLLISLGMLAAQICILGFCHTEHNMQMERAPRMLMRRPATLVFAGAEGSFVGFFYDFSFIRRKLKAFKGTSDSHTG